jgi:hypothetical protein
VGRRFEPGWEQFIRSWGALPTNRDDLGLSIDWSTNKGGLFTEDSDGVDEDMLMMMMMAPGEKFELDPIQGRKRPSSQPGISGRDTFFTHSPILTSFSATLHSPFSC